MCSQENGPISSPPQSDQLNNPIDLPEGLRWSVVDFEAVNQVQEVYCLLRDHYVEDNDELFRFHYQIDFLKWALMGPSMHPDWYVSIRCLESDKLVGFISAVPIELSVRDSYISFLSNI